MLESKVGSSNEVLEKIESSDGRVGDERIGWLRADFSQIYSETGFSPWCYEDKVSSGSGVEDKVSSNSPLIFCGVLGRAKKYSKFVVPFEWSEVCQWCGDRYCDESDYERDRRIEVFKLKRSYKELIERLELEKIDNMKYLPCEIKIDDYFDDTVVDDKHLPYEGIDIVNEYDDINYMEITNNIKGDWTKITQVDGFYESMGDKYVVNYYVNIINERGHYNNNYNVMYVNKNELCYKYIRLIYDDGG